MCAHFEGAIDPLGAALQAAEQIDERSLLVEGQLGLGTLLSDERRLAEADDELASSIQLCWIGDPPGRGPASSGVLCSTAAERSTRPRGSAATQEQWFERTGDTCLQLQNPRTLALYSPAREDAGLAEKRPLEALPIAFDTGD